MRLPAFVSDICFSVNFRHIEDSKIIELDIFWLKVKKFELSFKNFLFKINDTQMSNVDNLATSLNDVKLTSSSLLPTPNVTSSVTSLNDVDCHFCRRPSRVICERCDATFCSTDHLRLLHDVRRGRFEFKKSFYQYKTGPAF